MSKAELKIGSRTYGGWKEMQVQRSMQSAASAFSLKVSEKFPGQLEKWDINEDDECTLILDDHVAVVGHVDSVSRSYDEKSRSVTIAGRDKTADLVDCSATKSDGSTGSLNGQTLLQIAQLLAKPFGITVKVAPSLDISKPFKTFSIEPGETRWECIERAARQRAVLAMADGVGGLLLTRASTSVYAVPLIEGENILTATLNRDRSQRFHSYTALAQSGSNEWGSTEGAHLKATKLDSVARKPRGHIFQCEELADGITLEDRCTWERNVRRARANTLSIKVEGFSTSAGGLWVPNRLVRCKLPEFDIDQTLLITDVNSAVGEEGSTTEISISPRTAWELLPSAEEKDNGLGDW